MKIDITPEELDDLRYLNAPHSPLGKFIRALSQNPECGCQREEGCEGCREEERFSSRPPYLPADWAIVDWSGLMDAPSAEDVRSWELGSVAQPGGPDRFIVLHVKPYIEDEEVDVEF